MFNNLVEKSKEFFPDLEVKYKTESSFMKLIGKILFFNKTFMTFYTTTIGSTIYFPNREFVNNKEVSSSIIFLHELVHIHDSKNSSASSSAAWSMAAHSSSVMAAIWAS